MTLTIDLAWVLIHMVLPAVVGAVTAWLVVRRW